MKRLVRYPLLGRGLSLKLKDKPWVTRFDRYGDPWLREEDLPKLHAWLLEEKNGDYHKSAELALRYLQLNHPHVI